MKPSDQIAKAAKIARNLIHNPKDESDRIETPDDAGLDVRKGGYKNPPEDDIDPNLLRGAVTNPASAVARDTAEYELRVHRAHAQEVYDMVYKQARMAAYSLSEAREQAEVAKASVDREYRDSLRRQIAVEKSKLANMGVRT
jgi:hypothetical protein